MSSQSLPWATCDSCGKPIASPDEGAISTDYALAEKRHTMLEQAENASPAEAESIRVMGWLAGIPSEPISWRVDHWTCIPDKALADGLIDGAKIPAPEDLESERQHLQDIPWFDDTDWPNLVSRLNY